MAQQRVKRFYKEVSVGESDGGYAVLLDGKPLKTPSRSAYVVQSRALAGALAEEWRAQGDVIEPATMPLTRLVNTALEHVPINRGAIADQMLAMGKSDLVCYRAEAPEALAARQAEAWDPWLDWLEERYQARLATGQGIAYVEQPAEAVLSLEQAIWNQNDFGLTGLSAAATILGSLVLALALVEGRLGAADAFRLATLDEAFQAEKWGAVAEARARQDRMAAELAAVERFLQLA